MLTVISQTCDGCKILCTFYPLYIQLTKEDDVIESHCLKDMSLRIIKTTIKYNSTIMHLVNIEYITSSLKFLTGYVHEFLLLYLE